MLRDCRHTAPFATAKRLTIYRQLAPVGFDGPRLIFSAIAHMDEFTGAAVTAVVGEQPRPCLWWIETATMQRRQGFATELIELLTSLYPTLHISPGSSDGDVLVASWIERCRSGAVFPTGNPRADEVVR